MSDRNRWKGVLTARWHGNEQRLRQLSADDEQLIPTEQRWYSSEVY